MRGYASTLEAALQPERIPTDVYHNLIAAVNANLPLLRDKLAVQLAVLHDERGFERKPSYDITQRQFAVSSASPFPSPGQRNPLENMPSIGTVSPFIAA